MLSTLETTVVTSLSSVIELSTVDRLDKLILQSRRFVFLFTNLRLQLKLYVSEYLVHDKTFTSTDHSPFFFV